MREGNPCSAMYYMLGLSLLLLLVLFSISRSTNSSLQEKGFAFVAKMREVVKKTNKIAWFSWSDICKSKELGGLGVKDFISFNHALLGMWRWNLFHQKDCLWEDVLNSKYER